MNSGMSTAVGQIPRLSRKTKPKSQSPSTSAGTAKRMMRRNRHFRLGCHGTRGVSPALTACPGPTGGGAPADPPGADTRSPRRSVNLPAL